MKNAKRIIAIIIAVIMLATASPISAFAATKAPAKPATPTFSSTVNTITVNWKKVSGATGYELYKYNTSTKKYSKVTSTTKLKYKISKLKAGTNYVYAVKAYKTVKKKKYYSSYSSKLTATTLPSAPSGLKSSAKTHNTVSLAWSKVTGATGYVVYQYNSSTKKYTKLASTTKLSYKHSSLKPSTSYTYAVKAYKTLNKKTYYSAYTSKLTVKTYADVSKTLSTIDEKTTYQTIEGFGASGCWWAQRVGEGTESQIDAIMSLLYDKEKGIGLNIYRYNLGAGSKNDGVIYNQYRDTETFLESYNESTDELTYNWDNDAEAQKVLASAKKFAGDDLKVTLFCNSPPIQLTNNGYACSDDLGVEYWAGNRGTEVNYNNKNLLKDTRYALYHQNIGNTGKTNADAKAYMTFARYLTDIADHFEEIGYDVVDVSPVNEPQTAWTYTKENAYPNRIWMNQEGCHYTPEGLTRLAGYCALAGEGKPYKFSMFDSGAADGADEGSLDASSIKYISSMFNETNIVRDENGDDILVDGDSISFGKLNTSYYTNLSVHSYWCNKETKQEFNDYVRKNYPNVKTFTTTEFCQMTNDGSNGITEWNETNGYWQLMKELVNLENGDESMLSIKPGVQLAVTMYNDFTTLNSTEWDWWTACYFGGYPDALVYVNDNENLDNVRTAKRLWTMGNYSKFIHEGAKRVAITETQSDLLSTAWKNKDGSLVVVYINQTDKDIKTSIKASGYSKTSTYVTSSTMDLKNTANGTYSLYNSYSIPSQSVVTVVLK